MRSSISLRGKPSQQCIRHGSENLKHWRQGRRSGYISQKMFNLNDSKHKRPRTWRIMRRPNLWKIVLEEGEEKHIKITEITSNKIIEESFPNLTKEWPAYQGIRSIQDRAKKKKNSPGYIIIKTLSLQNKERIKDAREKI